MKSIAAAKKRKRKRAPAKKCWWKRDKRTRRKKKVCRKRRRPAPRKPAPIGRVPASPAPVPQPLPNLPVPSPAAPPATAPPPGPTPPPAPKPPPAPPTPVHGTFGRREAERLLWRAGFGPRPGEVERVAALGLQRAVDALADVSGTAPLTGAEPRTQDGNPVDPHNVWGHDHLWWLDRMVRSEHQLVERMTLIWHDWWATTNADVGQAGLMLAQNQTLRRHALGSFRDLARAMTTDPAMLVFLNGIENRRGRPNENYARELMELFTLGADRGAYTETDVRELARALTGWDADWQDGWVNFRFVATRHDTGTKSLWTGTPHARSGAFGWEDAVDLCLQNPFHRSFFVRKMWSYFVPTPPDAATQAALERIYVDSGYGIKPVVKAILRHPDLYAGAPLVKPPAVYAAGLMRARSRPVDTEAWVWYAEASGQRLFEPPNVSGWNDSAWLDTSTLRGRWILAREILNKEYVATSGYSATETPQEALASALAHWGNPSLTTETRAELERFATQCLPATLASWQQGPMRAYRQNALRHLIATCPDAQTC